MIATYGTVSITIYADGDFQHYGGGIFKSKSCGEEVNHAVSARIKSNI